MASVSVQHATDAGSSRLKEGTLSD